MAFKAANRVQETSTTSGTGTISLAGAAAQCQTFVSGIGNGNTCNYFIIDGNGIDWEAGTGTVTSGSPNTLTRTTVYESTNGGSKINLSSGNTHVVFCSAPAEHVIASKDLDNALGSTQGQIAYRNATGWTALSPGTSGQFLQTLGSSANPAWGDAITDALLDAKFGSGQGSIIYRGASSWAALTPGSATYVLTSNGSSSNPSWQAPSGGGGGGGTPPSIVQAAASVGTTSSVTFGSTPTHGNVMVAVGTHWSNNIGESTGWTRLLFTNGATTDGLNGAFKIAGASESTTQTPFQASGGGQSCCVFEITGMGGPITIVSSFQESAASTLSMDSFNSASGLIIGAFSVQASSFDYSISGATAVDVNVTGTTPNNSPRRIKGFHVDGASGAATVTATLDSGHDSAGWMFFIPGS